MFDQLVAVADSARGAGAVGGWARVENAACARRLAAMADLLDARLAADGSAEREQWCLDNWEAVSAEIGAAMNVSAGVASHQLLIAQALRDRLPRVAEVFSAGVIGYRLVDTIVGRTRLIQNRDVLAKIDAELAAHAAGWGALSAAKTERAIDYWVDRYDPQALRRTESRSRGRHLDVSADPDGAGTASVSGQLFGHHGAALTQRLDAMAHTVCEHDPRTIDQRRSDAMGALGLGADRLACECGRADCPAATAQPPSAVVVHVITEADSLTNDTPAHLDSPTPGPEPTPGPSPTNPAAVIGGPILPTPLLAAKLAGTATIRQLIHPGDSPPEPRYRPSRALADFVHCRDMTCRFPGCDEPAYRCDLDHTIAYPHGPTCASNIKCLCRKHHLLKTFWGWLDRQLPDGTVIWTSPSGQTYTTKPGSAILFPSLCRPTAPITTPAATTTPAEPSRDLAMPRRTHTRTQNRHRAIETERQLNNADIAERNKPPPF